MRELRGFLIDVNTGFAGIRIIKDDIYEYYKILNCESIDITCRYIAGRKFHIICDDIGALKDVRIPSILFNPYSPAIFGNVFILSGLNIDGDLFSLSSDDEIHLAHNLGGLYFEDLVNSNNNHFVPFIGNLDVK